MNAEENDRCPKCGQAVRIDRVRRPVTTGFGDVLPEPPIVRRAKCINGHVSWPDEKTTIDSLLNELPIDTCDLVTARGTWNIELRKIRVEAEHTMRIAELTLHGTPSYDLTVKIPGETLVVIHKEGDIEWLLRALRDWLMNPEPKGPKNELIIS